MNHTPFDSHDQWEKQAPDGEYCDICDDWDCHVACPNCGSKNCYHDSICISWYIFCNDCDVETPVLCTNCIYLQREKPAKHYCVHKEQHEKINDPEDHSCKNYEVKK